MSSLNTFLGDDSPDAEPTPAVVPTDPSPAPEPAQPDPEPALEPVDATPTEVPADPPPVDPVDAPAEPVEGEQTPADVKGLLAAVQATRRQREDHKGRADKLEGELAAHKAELEALRKAALTPPPAPPQPAAPVVQQQPAEPVPIPNPLEDPAGWQAYQSQVMLNERLNTSETILRSQIPDEDIDAKMEVFKKACDSNPSLRIQLAQQAHPWKWAYSHAQKLMAMDEIGADPAAYRSKLETELRAKIEAELLEKAAAATPEPAAALAPVAAAPAAPRPNIPASIATTRSAGPRESVVMEEAPSFAEVFARKKAAS